VTVSTIETKASLFDLNRSQLEKFFVNWGEKPFRAAQLVKWIHQRGVTDFSQMTNLSKSWRARLAEQFDLPTPQIIRAQEGADGTRKWLFRMIDGNGIETVYIPEANRGTLCVSSQVGCALDCRFCATGKQGFNRNLTAGEIIAQLWVARQQLSMVSQDRAVTNVVFMGMGEPLANFTNLVTSIELMLDDMAYGLSKRRVTVSTAGLVPAIYRLRQVTDVSLAVSLHAPNDALRDRLVPLNRKYPIAELMQACRDYLQGMNHRVITFEYTLIDGVNDAPAQAKELIRLLEGMPAKVNLIPFNPFPGTTFRRSSDEAVARFQARLSGAGITTTVRRTRGDDIDAACGQLAGYVKDRTQRQQQWKASLQGAA